MEAARTISVVGSANLDIVVTVDHHPATGETVMGGDHQLIPGGKGANQAVASALLGADVRFVGVVGGDDAGKTLRASLEGAGVNTDGLAVASDSPSGIALITVDAQGDNAITVSPGANALVDSALLDAHASALSADVVQLQLEIPLEAVTYAAQKATGTVVLDPAPAPSGGLPEELLSAVDVLVPNETELALLAGVEVDPSNPADLESAARSLGVESVVVTLGERGAFVVSGDLAESVPAPKITPVDTTAAGDAFRSALSVSLAGGSTLVEAAQFAVRVGAAAAMAYGAQPSLPTRDEVESRIS